MWPYFSFKQEGFLFLANSRGELVLICICNWGVFSLSPKLPLKKERQIYIMDFDLALSLHLCDIRGLASSSAVEPQPLQLGGVLVYHQNYPFKKGIG